MDIPQALQNLDWTRPEQDQTEARQYLVAHIGNDLSPLMIEALDKAQFENAARVLVEIGRPGIEAYIPQMLEWFMDMNWPGALVIGELLQGVDDRILTPHVMCAIKRAQNENDEVWIEFLEDFHQTIIKDKALQ